MSLASVNNTVSFRCFLSTNSTVGQASDFTTTSSMFPWFDIEVISGNNPYTLPFTNLLTPINTDFTIGDFIFQVVPQYGIKFKRIAASAVVNGSIYTILSDNIVAKSYTNVTVQTNIYTLNSYGTGTFTAGQTFSLLIIDETSGITYDLNVIMRNGLLNSSMSCRTY